MKVSNFRTLGVPLLRSTRYYLHRHRRNYVPLCLSYARQICQNSIKKWNNMVIPKSNQSLFNKFDLQNVQSKFQSSNYKKMQLYTLGVKFYWKCGSWYSLRNSVLIIISYIGLMIVHVLWVTRNKVIVGHGPKTPFPFTTSKALYRISDPSFLESQSKAKQRSECLSLPCVLFISPFLEGTPPTFDILLYGICL